MKSKKIEAFNDQNPFETLDEGECLEMDMKMDGEDFSAKACRVDEDKIHIESMEGEVEMDITRSEYEEGEFE